MMGLVWLVVWYFGPEGMFHHIQSREWWKPEQLQWPALVTVLLLGVLNYVLEAAKWRLLLPFQASWGLVFRSVLTGVAFSNIMPWKTGEFAGKIAVLPAPHRPLSAVRSIIGSMTQLSMTFLMGGMGCMIIWEHLTTGYSWSFSQWIGLAFGSIVLIFLLIKLLPTVFVNIRPLLLPSNSVPHAYQDITFGTYMAVGGLSLWRYLTFIASYGVMIYPHLEGVTLGQISAAIACAFMIQTPIPGFLFSDMPAKGWVHFSMFALITDTLWPMGNAIVVVFICNQLLPSMAGAMILWFHRTQPATPS
jgi:hypothetical protein